MPIYGHVAQIYSLMESLMHSLTCTHSLGKFEVINAVTFIDLVFGFAVF